MFGICDGKRWGHTRLVVKTSKCVIEREGPPAFGVNISLGGTGCPTQDTEFGAMGVIEKNGLGCILQRFSKFKFRFIGQ